MRIHVDTVVSKTKNVKPEKVAIVPSWIANGRQCSVCHFALGDDDCITVALYDGDIYWVHNACMDR